ncbi:hypothetical protein BT69DRAFT_1281269, partial [Atractiella rhizophila]
MIASSLILSLSFASVFAAPPTPNPSVLNGLALTQSNTERLADFAGVLAGTTQGTKSIPNAENVCPLSIPAVASEI